MKIQGYVVDDVNKRIYVFKDKDKQKPDFWQQFGIERCL